MKKYYGKETEAALQNFSFSGPRVPLSLIYAIAVIKQAAALSWMKIGEFDKVKAEAIIRAAKEILSHRFDEQFSLPALQGGGGTSLHMNVNEVIAARAREILKKERLSVHPNDDVNRGQSTNDVVPSALKIATLKIIERTLRAVKEFESALRKKSQEFRKIPKLGRTHLQDAVPITLGEEFLSYAETLQRNSQRIKEVLLFFHELNLGGTAVGNGVNSSKRFQQRLYHELNRMLKMRLRPAKNLMSQTASANDSCALSSALTILTLDASKIENDLRLMASGPRGGIGEIKVKALQSGSTIMPGKVNPVLLEVLSQLHFIVLGNDLAIRTAAQAAQLELSAMTPLIAEKFLASAELITEVFQKVARSCISKIAADEHQCRKHLDKSMAYATLLVPNLGYDRVANLVKTAIKKNKTLREILISKRFLEPKEFEKFL